MKICYIATTAHLPAEGADCIGSSVHTLSLAKALKDCGAEVVVISDWRECDKEIEERDGLKIYRLKRGFVASAKKLKRAFGKMLKPFRGISDAALVKKVAEIAKAEGCEILLERAQSKIGGEVAEQTGLPLVVEVIDEEFSKESLQKAKTIFAYTDVFFDEGEKRKLQIVEAAFDEKIFRPRNLQIEFDICYAGSFKEWDGLRHLVGAVKILKNDGFEDLKVALAGNGVEFESVRQMVAETELEKNFEFLGALKQEKVAELIGKSRVCVAPYDVGGTKIGWQKFGFYFSPLKVLEYMACGRPVVATDYAILEKWLGERQRFEEGDVQQLAEKIGALLRLGRKEYEDVCIKNYEVARRKTWRDLAGKIFDCAKMLKLEEIVVGAAR